VDVDGVSPEMGSVAALTVASVSRAADRENSDQGGRQHTDVGIVTPEEAVHFAPTGRAPAR
jgi:hypothetical protein